MFWGKQGLLFGRCIDEYDCRKSAWDSACVHSLPIVVHARLQWQNQNGLGGRRRAQLRAEDAAEGVQEGKVFLLAETLLPALSQEDQKTSLHPVHHQLGGMSDQYAAHDLVCLAAAGFVGANGIQYLFFY